MWNHYVYKNVWNDVPSVEMWNDYLFIKNVWNDKTAVRNVCEAFTVNDWCLGLQYLVRHTQE